MHGKPEPISIIIPAYNASAFIEETIRSIFGQTYSSWEMIIVDDGSTDNTASICEALNNPKVKLIRQKNCGVAVARNNGLLHAKGEFVIFFDADDIMTPDFLAERITALKNDPAISYVGGMLQTFPVKGEIKKAATDPVNEILFSSASFGTAPSNYVFRRKVLVDNGITFNPELSSSADRFFILEVSKFGKGKNLTSEKSKLLYRVTSQSMSNNITPGLIRDNEKFFYELKRKNLLPDGKEQKFKSLYFFSLAVGFGMVKYRKQVLKYLVMSFINHPLFFIRNCGKKIIAFSYLKLLRLNG